MTCTADLPETVTSMIFFRYISNSGQFSKTRQFIQHGDTSVYSHCVAVAYVSLWFSYRLHISVSKQSLLMGAFLHDYFLYDWHENDPSHRLHGFTIQSVL